MTDDRSFERAARSWLEEGPTRAPDRRVDAALARIQTTKQERDLRVPWRLPTMNPFVRLAGAALVAVVAIGVAFLAFQPNLTVGPVATPSAAATQAAPSSASFVSPLRDGLYAGGPVSVTEILDRLEQDPELNAEGRAAVRTILGLDTGSDLYVRILVADDRFTVSYGTDEANLEQEPPWSLYVLDATTIATGREQLNPTITAWRVGREANGFTLRAMSPAGDPVEAFVRRVLFETALFAPVP